MNLTIVRAIKYGSLIKLVYDDVERVALFCNYGISVADNESVRVFEYSKKDLYTQKIEMTYMWKLYLVSKMKKLMILRETFIEPEKQSLSYSLRDKGMKMAFNCGVLV